MVFYEGPLQTGVALAVKEAKPVICFVRDEAPESLQWEKEYFADGEIAQLLKDNAVALRLAAGSQELGFLTSFCPITKLPTVVVIRNGMLHEYIAAGTSKGDFRSRLRAVLGDYISTPIASESQRARNPANVTSAFAGTGPAPSMSADLRPESEVARERAGAARQRAKSTEAGKKHVDANPIYDQLKLDWQGVEEQQNGLDLRREEQDRILEQVKQDADDRNRKEQRNASAAGIDESSVTQKAPGSRHVVTEEYRLQVRLFDGSSVRSSFSPLDTIHDGVRPWLDRQCADGTRPYTLKHILTPLLNRPIMISEEKKTLADLGLGPNANLVMVPVQSYFQAYAAAGPSFALRGLYAGYNILSRAIGTVAGMVSSFLGYSPNGVAVPIRTATLSSASFAQRSDNGLNSQRSVSRGANITTLKDRPDEQNNDQFYNGNQLNFEPWRGNDGKND
ncbi:hypothetical protein VTN00DRAFT_7363 [Thermoascus crustaceus]|uniref:uncharacterized protein n=1 Tax=Thermoascus crustaceus TaxID=5088 RepID=UPI0037437CA2